MVLYAQCDFPAPFGREVLSLLARYHRPTIRLSLGLLLA